MAGQRVELSLTESFAKHKRNVLFVSAIVAILVVASPAQVKIPGFGDEAIPARIAYFLLLCTLLYFFLSYVVELLAVRARNLDGTAENSMDEIVARLKRAIHPIEQHAEKLGFFGSRLWDYQEKYNKLFAEYDVEADLSRVKEAISEAVGKMDDLVNRETKVSNTSFAFNDINDKVFRVKSRLDEINNLSISLREMQVSIDETSKEALTEVSKLSKKFDRISSRISRSQRVGFGVLEQGVPIVLALCALVACVDGSIFGAAGAKAVRSYIIAEQPAPTLDAPTGTRTAQNP